MSKTVWSVLGTSSTLPSSARFVLCELAWRARDKGEFRGICWPSLQTIGKDTGLTERTVRRSLDALSAASIIKVTPKAYGQQKRGNVYTLDIDYLERIAASAVVSPDTVTAVDDATPDIVSAVHRTLATSTPDIDDSLYRKNKEENKEVEPSVADAPVCVLDFGEEDNLQPCFTKQEVEWIRLAYPGCVLNFYGGDCPPIPPPSKPKLVKPLPLSEQDVETIRLAYPRKVAPVPARKAILAQYALLVKGGVLTAGGLHLPMMTARNAMAFLLERTGLYANSPKGMSEQFIPYPATWFNAGSYTEDESAWNVCSTSSTRQVAQITYSDPEEMNAR